MPYTKLQVLAQTVYVNLTDHDCSYMYCYKLLTRSNKLNHSAHSTITCPLIIHVHVALVQASYAHSQHLQTATQSLQCASSAHCNYSLTGMIMKNKQPQRRVSYTKRHSQEVSSTIRHLLCSNLIGQNDTIMLQCVIHIHDGTLIRMGMESLGQVVTVVATRI